MNEPIAIIGSTEITRDELEILLQDAVESFSRVRAQKTEIDLIYVAAATRLNTVERVVTKMNQRAVLVQRQANLIAMRAKKTTTDTSASKKVGLDGGRTVQ